MTNEILVEAVMLDYQRKANELIQSIQSCGSMVEIAGAYEKMRDLTLEADKAINEVLSGTPLVVDQDAE